MGPTVTNINGFLSIPVHPAHADVCSVSIKYCEKVIIGHDFQRMFYQIKSIQMEDVKFQHF